MSGARLPVLERFGERDLDLKDPQERFERSEWNYTVVDPESGALMGYWEAERIGLGTDEFHEVMIVLEGQIEVTCEGNVETAGPGDTILVRADRPTALAVPDHARAFFVCYGMDDPVRYEEGIRNAMRSKGL